MAISLVHPNERHTGILCLLVKYLLWQCATFGNTITLTDFRTVGASTLNSTLRIFLWNISKNNILEFGAYWWSICFGSVLYRYIYMWTTFGKHNYFGRPIFEQLVQPLWTERTLRIFLWNISKNNIPEFVIYWKSICLGSVLFGQIFVTTISLAVFWIVPASHLLWAWWIFLWNIPKNNIMKFGAYLYSIYPGSVLVGHFWGNAIC